MIKDLILRNPKIYTTDRGLTKKDQQAPVKVTHTDSSWLKAGPMEEAKGGTIVVADTYQKFIPYQSKFESTKTNTSGIIKQSTKEHPWIEYSEDVWESNIKFPINFKGDYDIQKWYTSKFETDKEIFQWKTDIFGNQYGLYKTFDNKSLYEKQNQMGELWVCSPTNFIQAASAALSAIFTNYLAINTTIYSDLTSNNITNIDVFYDTLMITTSSGITFDKITIDTDTITSIADYTHIVSLSANEYFADTWFFEDSKTVVLCTVLLSAGQPIPNLYELDLNKNVLVHQPVTNLSLLSAFNYSSIDRPTLSYNSTLQTYSIVFNNQTSFGIVNIKKSEIISITNF